MTHVYGIGAFFAISRKCSKYARKIIINFGSKKVPNMFGSVESRFGSVWFGSVGLVGSERTTEPNRGSVDH
jgi:hypothetical protein